MISSILASGRYEFWGKNNLDFILSFLIFINSRNGLKLINSLCFAIDSFWYLINPDQRRYEQGSFVFVLYHSAKFDPNPLFL